MDVQRSLDRHRGRAGFREAGVPGQQFAEAVDGVIGEAFEDITQVGFRIDAVKLGRAQQAVDGRRALSAGIRSGEEIVLAAEGDHAQRPFRRVVIDLDVAVVSIKPAAPAKGPERSGSPWRFRTSGPVWAGSL